MLDLGGKGDRRRPVSRPDIALFPLRPAKADRGSQKILFGKGHDRVKLAAPRLDCLGDQYVGAACERAIGDQGARFGQDLVDRPGELFFHLPAGTEHVAAEMDHRRGPDRGQQGSPLLIRHCKTPGDQRHLPGGRGDHSRRGIGPVPRLGVELRRPFDLAADQHRLGMRGGGIIVLGMRHIRPAPDRVGKLAGRLYVARKEGCGRGIDPGKIAVRKLVRLVICLAGLAEQLDLFVAVGTDGEVFQQPSLERHRIFGADLVDPVALIDAKRGIGVSQPRHGQRLQIAGARIVGKLPDRLARPFEQRKHVAASQRIVEPATEFGVDHVGHWLIQTISRGCRRRGDWCRRASRLASSFGQGRSLRLASPAAFG
jgi:hypothetical protein